MINYHTKWVADGKIEDCVTIDSRLLEFVDRYVRGHEYESRSRFFENAVAERVERYEKGRGSLRGSAIWSGEIHGFIKLTIQLLVRTPLRPVSSLGPVAGAIS